MQLRFRACLQLPILFSILPLQAQSPDLTAVQRTLDEVRASSFPELSAARISVHSFHSESDFFRAQFNPFAFLSGAKMRFVIGVNSKALVLQLPGDGLRAILAHELSHVVYYTHGKRVRLLGLVRLVSGRFRSRFERNTDLEAIRRGYGEGLKEYRVWLYQSVPPRALRGKKKDYLTPEEIDVELRRCHIQPAHCNPLRSQK